MATSKYSDTFRLFHRAILERKQVVLVYDGQRREVCPVILGHKDGEERVLVYQFGGASSSRIPDWKCLNLAKVKDPHMRDGEWISGDSHKFGQQCIDEVFIDVNTEVPNQPGRRLRLIK